MIGDRKEVNGNENITIQGNNNSNNTIIMNSAEKKEIELNIEEDLKEIIVAFKEGLQLNNNSSNKLKQDFEKIDLIEKNKKNRLSESYYENIVKEHFIYFEEIDLFLKDPCNSDEKELFYDIVSELKTKQILCKDQFENFEKFLEYVRDKVLSKYNALLKRKKRFINIFLHFMYCRCMIGEKVKSV